MKTIHSILMSIMFILTVSVCNAQTAYEKKVFEEAKVSFKLFYGKELKVSQVKQLSRADMAKFLKTMDPVDLKNPPCEISGLPGSDRKWYSIVRTYLQMPNVMQWNRRLLDVPMMLKSTIKWEVQTEFPFFDVGEMEITHSGDRGCGFV